MEGGKEQSLPGGEAEGKFCIALSKLVNLDEVRLVWSRPCLLALLWLLLYLVGSTLLLSIVTEMAIYMSQDVTSGNGTLSLRRGSVVQRSEVAILEIASCR